MSKYKITLTPVDKFYFGGDMTFQVGNDERDKHNRYYSSYIIQSSYFPQQTSLLGMLRYLILRNAGTEVFDGNKIVDTKEAANWIGGSSFTVNNGKNTNSFGKIKNISRVRVLRGDTELDFAPLFGSIQTIDKVNGTYNLGFLEIPNITKKQFSAKDGGLPTLLVPTKKINDFFKNYQEEIVKHKKEIKKREDDEAMGIEPIAPNYPYELSDIFVEDHRIGISRNIRTGKTDNGALFKQISYRFNDKWAKHCFVFEAEVDGINLTDKAYNGQLVSIGGDNSQFVIGITEVTTTPNNAKEDYPTLQAITLLSPSYISREVVRQNTCFAITRLMPFRFLESIMEKTESYHILSQNLKRSNRYELYAPGTVFYFDKQKLPSSFIQSIIGRNDFRQIGYNEYKLIK